MENSKNFYQPELIDADHKRKPRVTNKKYPVLTNLEGFFGEPRLNILLKKAQHFIKYPALLLDIFAGLPGGGKSTVGQEYKEQMDDWGYHRRLSYSYEEALSEFHRPGEEITYDIWVKTNNRLFEVVINEQKKYAQDYANEDTTKKGRKKRRPEYMMVEVPGISLHLPSNRKFKSPENRDRGVSFLRMLASVLMKYPIYILPITGEPQGRIQAVEQRQEILTLGSKLQENSEEVINAYLWTKTLLDPELKIDPQALLNLLESMAMPHHLATIHKEFNQHKSNYMKKTIRDMYNLVLKMRGVALGRPVTERDAIILLEMLTFNHFLTKGIGLDQTRII
jgi:hypothetical protein